MSTKYQAPSVKKAFQILRLISREKQGLGISELAKRLKLSKGTVHGITIALEDEGAIIRDPVTKKFTLGYTIVELGKKGLSKMPLRAVARRHMEGLVDEIGETAFLGVLKDDSVFVLDVVESTSDFKITSPSGIKLSLSAGATGKLFLAHMDPKASRQYLSTKGLVKYTDQTIIDLNLFLQELVEIRKQGYAIDREEYLDGVRAVAAMIKTDEAPLAGIWVVGFSASLDNRKIQHVANRTLDVAERISRDLTHND